MPLGPTITLIALLVAVVVWMIWNLIQTRNWLRFAFQVLAIVVYCLVLRILFDFPFALTTVAKGPEDHTKFLALVAALYVCEVLGMIAEFFYTSLEFEGRKRRKLQLRQLVRPLLISPLVFIPLIPLIGSFQNVNVDLTLLNAPRLMLFLLAFEQGFLWRGYHWRRHSPLAGAGHNAA